MKRELQIQIMSNKLIEKEILIFDFDGTLADTSTLHERAFKEILKPYSINFKYKDIAGKRTKDAIDHIIQCAGKEFAKDELEKLVHTKQKLVRKLIKSDLKPIEGVNEFLAWAKKRYFLALCTSGSRETIEISLEKIGYLNFFNLMICSEDVSNGKPNPEGFLKIINITKIKKNNALIFEDSEIGIEAAKRAGIDFIDVRNGFFKNFRFYSNMDGV